MTIEYKQFNDRFIEDKHGRIFYYRKMYLGLHHEIFERAAKLIEDGELLNNLLSKNQETPFVQTPYIVANISKLIINVPATLVARSIGKIDTSTEQSDEQIKNSTAEGTADIEGPTGDPINNRVDNLQHEIIEQIVKNSKLRTEHWGNIVQHQLDGGLVGVPINDSRGQRIEFKGRDVYFPHEDDLGADLTYTRTIEEQDYLHVYRERLETDELEGPGLRATHTLYELGKGGIIEETKISKAKTAALLNMDEDDLSRFYGGRTNLFIQYWANEKTFMNPLGVSAIAGQEGTQDEINWVVTRTAAIFERNAKPRIAINKDLAAALQKEMVRIYGVNAKGKFDHRQLEVVSMDDKGKSMEIIQIDISKIGDITWVKELIKMMLMETQTSEKAVDFYQDKGANASAQSGIAKFYDLFISLMKAEYIQGEYIHFLKHLIKDALWLANKDNPAILVEEPVIKLESMIPISRKELKEEELLAYLGANGHAAQSLETTVRNMHPDKPEEWVQEEVARIQSERVADNSISLGATGRQTVSQMLDNPLNRPGAKPEPTGGKPDEKPTQ